MFMLYYEASTKEVHAVNGSGTAPAALTLERCLADLAQAPTPAASAGGPTARFDDIPPLHPHSVTVPGAAAGWCDAVSKFGSGALTLSQLMEPAALLAEEGFPVSPITAHHWGLSAYQLETGPNKGTLYLYTKLKYCISVACSSSFVPCLEPDFFCGARERSEGGSADTCCLVSASLPENRVPVNTICTYFLFS